MNQSTRIFPLLVASALTLSACATAPVSVPASAAFEVGQQAAFEGEVVSVDTAPWAYDGNAIVAVSSSASGTVKVQLPARWNLCKAQPLADVQALRPGDRVRIVGTVTAADEVVVCQQPQDVLRKLE